MEIELEKKEKVLDQGDAEEVDMAARRSRMRRRMIEA